MTNEFAAFNGVLWQCDWYLLPMEMQKLFVIVMADAQQSVFIRGYGKSLFIRDLLKKVQRRFFFLIK